MVMALRRPLPEAASLPAAAKMSLPLPLPGSVAGASGRRTSRSKKKMQEMRSIVEG